LKVSNFRSVKTDSFSRLGGHSVVSPHAVAVNANTKPVTIVAIFMWLPMGLS
jgi:hypothetical protein